MNILVANWTWFPSGGDWTYIENITELYEENGHNVIPFSMHDKRNIPSAYQQHFISNINYKELNVNRKLSSGLKVLSKSIYSYEAKEKLENLLNEVDIQLAHLNLIHHYITPSILEVLKKRNIPVIWSLHDYTAICPQSTFISNDKICEDCKGGKFYNAVLNKCKKNSLLPSVAAAAENYIHYARGYYKYVDYFICPSVFSFKKYKSFGFFEDKLHHLYHPYYFDYPEANSVSEASVKDKYIVFVGRLEKIKGAQTLLKAMEKHPEIKLKIIGDGTDEDNLKIQAKQSNLNNVEFVGNRTKYEVLSAIKDAMFLVCPSEWYEVLGFTIIEAMFLGKPVIGANIGAIPETVIHNKTGFLFEMGNAANLAEKINELYYHDELIKTFGVQARAHVSNLFDPPKYFENLKRIIPLL